MKIIFTRAISALFAGVVHVNGQNLSLRSDTAVDYHKDFPGVVRLNKFRKGRIISDVPEVKFKVFDTAKARPRRLGPDDDDNDDDDEDDDYLVTKVPEFLSFSIENDETNSDVCTTGCEGHYKEIFDAMKNLWKEKYAEYEIFFLTQGRYAVVAGVIAANFPDRVLDLHYDHPEVDTLILVQVPGSNNDDELVVGAQLVNLFGYQTCVPSDGHVASGGTDLFSAGAKRFATPGAQIGIHSWEHDDKPGSDYPRDHPQHYKYLKFFRRNCIPEDFYWEQLSYGLPMHYITEEEINTKFPYLRDCGGTCHTDKPTTNKPTTDKPTKSHETTKSKKRKKAGKKKKGKVGKARKSL
mmetsp:Transcript_21761/g.43637  ORF Transcript_21761/g.43637 Transcript_21761/m.43637 type:complete len:352 (+) Transcript_21761:212-1267(+)